MNLRSRLKTPFGRRAAAIGVAGDSIEDFLEGFPSVKREQVIAILEASHHHLLMST